MIIDTFTFWKELEILEIRLNELYHSVDKFILCEAAFTQSLIPKPYYFEENKDKFKKFLDKIVVVHVEKSVDISTNPWAFENHQRACIDIGLRSLNLSDDDIVLVSDLDEIPSSESLIENLPKLDKILCFGLMYNVYYLNLRMDNKVWNGTVAAKWSDVKNIDPNKLIQYRSHLPEDLIIKNSGWHLGYQGGKQMIFEKYFSCIEPFNKNDVPSRDLFYETFKERAVDGGSFIFCDNLARNDLRLSKIPDGELPKFVIENKEQFKEFLL